MSIASDRSPAITAKLTFSFPLTVRKLVTGAKLKKSSDELCLKFVENKLKIVF
jgi:hypothetical protein